MKRKPRESAKWLTLYLIKVQRSHAARAKALEFFQLLPVRRRAAQRLHGDVVRLAVEADDMAALALDEEWLRRKLRLALSIESRDGIDALGDGVWRLGDSRCSPVLLARDLIRLWREPALLDRVRVAGGPIRVITPKPRETPIVLRSRFC